LIQVEPIAASPEILCERFLALAADVLSPAPDTLRPYDRLLASVQNGRPGAVLLLDELTELRTLSYFPGVSKPLESFLESLAGGRRSPRSVVTSRFPSWLSSQRESWPEPIRSESTVFPVPPFDAAELEGHGIGEAEGIVAATAGLPVHVLTLVERTRAGESLNEALAAELAVGRCIEAECRGTLGELLHRARGYGACKAALSVLAAEEQLSLTEIARRLSRTAGSTRDYLRWLEEVELITVQSKRFAFVDPVLRLWLRLYGGGQPPTEEDILSEVELHLQRRKPAPAPPAEAPEPAPRPPTRPEELMEID